MSEQALKSGSLQGTVLHVKSFMSVSEMQRWLKSLFFPFKNYNTLFTSLSFIIKLLSNEKKNPRKKKTKCSLRKEKKIGTLLLI